MPRPTPGQLKFPRNPHVRHKPSGRAVAGFAQMGRPRIDWLGETFKHPPGYVPVYPGLTDLEAFRAGIDAYGRREMLSTNPHRGRTAQERKAWNSWYDGWAWAASKDCGFVPSFTGEKWRSLGKDWRPQRQRVAVAV